jgi:Flp pilus assembly protein TadG
MKLKKLFHTKSRAQAMVEFAIALPVLLLLLYGILETGRLVFMYSTVVNASRQAVRYGATTGPGNGTGNADEKRYEDCDGIRDSAQKSGFVGAFNTVTIKWDTGPGTGQTTICPNTSDPTFDWTPTGNNTRLNVTVTKNFTPLVPKLVPFLARTITATSARSIITSVTISVTSSPNNLVATTTTITSDNPDPSDIGQNVTVVVTVTGGTPKPSGTVTITGADMNCTAPLDSNGNASCNVIFNSGGAKTLTANYNGDTTHATSADTEPHKVRYATTTTITAHTPDPATINQAVNVSVTVTNGGLAFTGTQQVTITGADSNCTITLNNGTGTGSCNVTFTTTGTKTLTATYAGDTDHTGSSNTASHDVLINKDTITRITGHSPDPSETNQSVTVSVKVVGLTTPTGTVSITGADTNCTITLTGGTGSCSVIFNSAGGKSISAIYSGDANHNTSSTSTGHIVNLPATTTTITAHTPNPSLIGQTVNVTVAVTGGATTPTGTVTITGADAPCTITLPATNCNVVFSSTGTKTLSATYSGDTTHATSNGIATHTVSVTSGTPVPACNAVTHGTISKSGNTMTMTITNPYTFPLYTGVGSVTWNHDKGHQVGLDKSLSLQNITLGTTVVWSGSSSNTDTIPWTTTATIPANTTVTITFTFQQSYDNFDGTEFIYINLLTPGCETDPIHS